MKLAISRSTLTVATSKVADAVSVSSAADLAKNFSNAEMAKIYNGVVPAAKRVATFKTAKTESSAKVYAALTAASPVVKAVKATGTKKATPKAATTGVKKVRDSKLQRMAAAFRETTSGGNPRSFTIAQLVDKCGVTTNIAHQYISILRSKTDRFVMDIKKVKEEGKEATYSL